MTIEEVAGEDQTVASKEEMTANFGSLRQLQSSSSLIDLN